MATKKCPPDMEQLGTCVPPEMKQQAEAIRKARGKRLRFDPPIYTVWQDAFAIGFKHMDPETGYERKTAPGAAVIAGRLPAFDLSPFENDDAGLYPAMDEFPLPMWEDGLVLDNRHVNPALERYAWRPKADFAGLQWASLLHPEDQEPILRQTAAKFQTLRPFGLTYRFRRWDGQYDWIVDYVQPRFLHGRCVGYVGQMSPFPAGSIVVIVPDKPPATEEGATPIAPSSTCSPARRPWPGPLGSRAKASS